MKIPLFKNIVALTLLIILVIGVLTFPIPIQSDIGSGDFRPYWSSSFLLRKGQDFSDLSNVDFIERSQTNWRESYTMSAWFAPTGNLILLPYTFLPFTHAVHYWLITNVLIVFFSAILLWQHIKIHVWIPLGVFLTFPATLVSLYMGQVNTLVVLGLSLFIFLRAKKHDFLAGVCLTLLTIKPHLVIITLPLLILNTIWQRKPKVLAGFISALVICALILWGIYPHWLNSFWQVITSGMSSFREAPTIPGLLVHAGCGYGKWLWIIVLSLAIIIWWKLKSKVNQRNLIDTTILVGILVSPVGWSYDQIILLIPLLHIFEWMVDKVLPKGNTMVIVFTLVIVNSLYFYQRTLSVSEVWFFWVPLVAIIIYMLTWKQIRVKISDTTLVAETG